ncbi:MAG: pseudouridine synthase [Verrucomicrobiae bacterium]|nr:pseudouridine synthase [Verrucomicrobiae bacterium]
MLCHPHPSICSGKPARSHLRLLQRFRGYSWLEIETETGRLHQVRVHCQAAGFPLVGDTDYGGSPLFLRQLKRHYKTKPTDPERPLIARPALHAAQLTLAEPAMTFTAPLPKDLRIALKYLQRFAAL